MFKNLFRRRIRLDEKSVIEKIIFLKFNLCNLIGLFRFILDKIRLNRFKMF